MRHFRLDRIKRASVTTSSFEPRPEVNPAAEVDGWLRTGEVRRRARRASGSRPSAPAGRASSARSSSECDDGSIVVELSFAGVDWLVREVLKEAGDAAVLEPGAREAVPRRGARRPPQASTGLRVSRRDQIRMSDAEVDAFLARASAR